MANSTWLRYFAVMLLPLGYQLTTCFFFSEGYAAEQAVPFRYGYHWHALRDMFVSIITIIAVVVITVVASLAQAILAQVHWIKGGGR